ncbi:MAG: hypothetical protein Q9214_006934 [Letrouitia sp. 1 TL-2023]
MIVDLPISIDGSPLDTQVRDSLKEIGVETASYQSPVPNVIRWRRKVEARFDAQKGYRVQLTTKEIDIEKHVICFMAAQDFVSLATADPDSDGKDLNTHVLDIKRAFDGYIPIYLIEGLDNWMNKNKNARNRAYKASVNGDVRNQADSSTSGGCAAAPRRKRPPIKIVDENMIEDALLRLQIMNGCMIHHTIKTDDSAEWVVHFTEHISQIPYRNEQMTHGTTFCMESGQVKAGKDKHDTFLCMLQENIRITPSIAHAIAEKYPNVNKLVEAMEKIGPSALEKVKKDGEDAEKNIGPVISKRLYKVFMDLDPMTADI